MARKSRGADLSAAAPSAGPEAKADFFGRKLVEISIQYSLKLRKTKTALAMAVFPGKTPNNALRRLSALQDKKKPQKLRFSEAYLMAEFLGISIADLCHHVQSHVTDEKVLQPLSGKPPQE
ncbi:MAG TPA: hypothetical protein PK250_12910 [Syntrophobacter fumaroxidans]|nr:hypothetical protein [Syntrophobacter fumaroxidans]